MFIYNYKSNNMINNFDLDKIGIPGFNQGDKSSLIRVDKGGEYAVLESSDNWFDVDSFIEYHIINFKSGEVNKINQSEIPKDFSQFETEPMKYHPESDADERFDLPYSWPGEIMASYINSNGERISFYTNIERNSDNRVIIGNTDLVIVSPDRSYTTQRIFGCLFFGIQQLDRYTTATKNFCRRFLPVRILCYINNFKNMQPNSFFGW